MNDLRRTAAEQNRWARANRSCAEGKISDGHVGLTNHKHRLGVDSSERDLRMPKIKNGSLAWMKASSVALLSAATTVCWTQTLEHLMHKAIVSAITPCCLKLLSSSRYFSGDRECFHRTLEWLWLFIKKLQGQLTMKLKKYYSNLVNNSVSDPHLTIVKCIIILYIL